MTSHLILVKNVVPKSESMVLFSEFIQNLSGFINMNYRFLQVKWCIRIREIFNKGKLVEMSKQMFLDEGCNDVNIRKNVIFDLKDGVYVKIYVDEIIFIEVNIRTCTVHTKKGEYEAKGISLKQAINLINSKDIIQCHKSFAVNTNYIKKIKKISIKSYELFFEDYEKTALLSYKCKDVIMESFKNNGFDISEIS